MKKSQKTGGGKGEKERKNYGLRELSTVKGRRLESALPQQAVAIAKGEGTRVSRPEKQS